jgi:hypothetical protein
MAPGQQRNGRNCTPKTLHDETSEEESENETEKWPLDNSETEETARPRHFKPKKLSTLQFALVESHTCCCLRPFLLVRPTDRSRLYRLHFVSSSLCSFHFSISPSPCLPWFMSSRLQPFYSVRNPPCALTLAGSTLFRILPPRPSLLCSFPLFAFVSLRSYST